MSDPPSCSLSAFIRRSGPGRQALKPGRGRIDGRGNSSDQYPYRAQLANASTKRSGPKVLKPGQKQPLDNGKDDRGRNAEH